MPFLLWGTCLNERSWWPAAEGTTLRVMGVAADRLVVSGDFEGEDAIMGGGDGVEGEGGIGSTGDGVAVEFPLVGNVRASGEGGEGEGLAFVDGDGGAGDVGLDAELGGGGEVEIGEGALVEFSAAAVVDEEIEVGVGGLDPDGIDGIGEAGCVEEIPGVALVGGEPESISFGSKKVGGVGANVVIVAEEIGFYP